MNAEFLEWLFMKVIAPAGTFLGGFLMYMLKNRYSQKRNEKTELEKVQAAIKIWSDTAERLEKMLEQKDDRIDHLQKQLNGISAQNESLLKKVTHLERQNTELTKIINNYEKRNE